MDRKQRKPTIFFILPHGGYPLLPATLATMAWLVSLSIDGCDFVTLTGPGKALIALTAEEAIPYAEIGFNGYRLPTYYGGDQWETQYGECLPFPSEKGDFKWDEDSYWKFGSVTYTIATIFGGGSCLFLWFVTIGLNVTKRIWRCVGVELVIAAVFNILTFFWFANHQCTAEGSQCNFFFGSKASIYTLLFYTSAALSMFLKYPDPKILNLAKKQIQRDYEELKQDPNMSNYEIEIGTRFSAAENTQNRSSRTRRESLR